MHIALYALYYNNYRNQGVWKWFYIFKKCHQTSTYDALNLIELNVR